MSQDQSLTVIDATDAQVLAPAPSHSALTVQQSDELAKCRAHLSRLGKRIASKELDVVYLYVEAGFYLLKAHAIHHCDIVSQRSEGRFVATDQGFGKWLESHSTPIDRRRAERYMQGARNCGLTAESHIINLQTIKAEKKLHGQTLTALCRRPVDKAEKQLQLHEVSDAEALRFDKEERLARWTKVGAFLQKDGLEDGDWSHLDAEPRKAFYDLITELACRMRPSFKKRVGQKSEPQ